VIINDPKTLADVQVAFEGYEHALLDNDNEALAAFFLDDPTTTRYGVGDHQHGYAEIMAFRATQKPFARTLEHTVITAYGTDFAVASTLFHRDELKGQTGRQTQIWVKTAEGWKVAAAHVSMIETPA
jgi:ketosteroid isomerase-like protein